MMRQAPRRVLTRCRGVIRSSVAAASAPAPWALLGRSEPPPRRVEPGLETATVMGLPFHALDHEMLARRFVDGARAGKGGWTVTPNVDILRQFTMSSESRELILAASHRVADGL